MTARLVELTKNQAVRNRLVLGTLTLHDSAPIDLGGHGFTFGNGCALGDGRRRRKCGR